MKIPINYVLVKPDEELFEYITLEGTDVKIKVDRTFETGAHSTTSGIVMVAPEKLYFNYDNHSKSLRWDAQMELQAGDRVIFHYNAIKHALSNGMVINGGVLIKYDGLFVRLRNENKEVHPLNGIILAEPLQEEIKTDVIIPETFDATLRTKSTVRYVGTPLKGYIDFPEDGADDGAVKVGDVIVHSAFDCIPIQYSIYQCFDKGVTLWRMRERDIDAVEEKQKVHIGNGVFA